MKSITVHIHEPLGIEALQNVFANIMNKVGHPTCLSGFNISFTNAVDPAERVFLVEKGNQHILGV
jgi:hypothetical protein